MMIARYPAQFKTEAAKQVTGENPRQMYLITLKVSTIEFEGTVT